MNLSILVKKIWNALSQKPNFARFKSGDKSFDWKYYLCLHKRYFDTGFGITGYAKYGIALFGISSLNVKDTLIIGFIYGVFCYLLGWWWFKFNFVRAEVEVSNQVNPFVEEMRDKIK